MACIACKTAACASTGRTRVIGDKTKDPIAAVALAVQGAVGDGGNNSYAGARGTLAGTRVRQGEPERGAAGGRSNGRGRKLGDSVTSCR